MSRNGAIDRLRGIVMVLMALDHARDFFGDGRDPTNMTKTTVVLFFTRWITHFCAPVFVLLAGTGAFMMLHRDGDKRAVSKFLLTRGAWLIFLELTVIRMGWFFFGVTWRWWGVQVIWAIGWSMIALAALVYAPPRVVGVFGVAMIALHNLLDHVQLGPKWLSMVLHTQGMIDAPNGVRVFIVYPLIPWIGVICAGFALGEVLLREDRRRILARMGIAAIIAFVVIRGFNHYGDPQPWTADQHPVLSFLNCHKYPPSLDYLLMTLGPALLALAALERVEWRPFEVIGRVPLFYYIAHIYLLHAGAAVLAYVLRGENILRKPFFMGGANLSLGSVYIAWTLGVLLLYPLCVWYAALKARRRDVWVLRYL